MQSIDLGELKQLEEDLKALLEDIPEMRRGLHERIADNIKEEVDTQINNSGIKDSTGKVKDWQESHTGSAGGYAAVRATDSSVGGNSPGAITNYLEGGHAIRRPSGNNKKYRPRIKKAYVDGFHFYKSAESTVESKVIAVAEEFVEEMTRRLEG